MADENQIYYDMQDEAAAIDNVVHDLIQTLKEEDVNKGIFVAKDGDVNAEVKFHLIAKDMKSTIDYFMGGGDENEILVGDENNRIKGSEVYFERNDAGIEEQFNADTVNLKGNNSYLTISPTQFVYNYNTAVDEDGQIIQPTTYSSLYVDSGILAYTGIDDANKSNFTIGPTNAAFSGQNETYSYTGFITNQSMGAKGTNKTNNSDFYNLSITPNNVTISNSGDRQLDINSQQIYLKRGHDPSAYASTVDIRGISKFFMSNDTYPLNGSGGSVSGLTSNVYSFNMNSYTNYDPYGSQLLIDDSGAAFIRGCAKIYLDSQGWSPYNYTLDYYDDSINLSLRQGNYIHKTTSGPVIAAQGCAFVYFNGSPIFCVNDNARVIIDNNCRFTMHGCSRVDITGQPVGSLSKSLVFNNSETDMQSYKYVTPEIYIHDGVKINIDSGYTYDSDKRRYVYNYTGPCRADFNKLASVLVYLHDKATIDMSEGCWLKMTGTSMLDLADTSTLQMHNNSYIFMDDNSQISMSNDGAKSPLLKMSGCAGILMQSDEGDWGPLLAGQPTSFIFMGDGANGRTGQNTIDGITHDGGFGFSGVASSLSYRLSCLTEKMNYWGDKNMIQRQQDGPAAPVIKVAGYSTLVVENEHPGGVYIQIGNYESDPSDWGINMFMHGDFYFNSGKHNHIELFGGWIQTTGNPHTEIHDNTHFVFRGNLTAETPWLDGLYWSPLKEKEDGIITWQNFNSARCVTPVDSPVIQMYDSPNFYMRGYWEDTTETPIQKEEEMYFSIEDEPEFFEEIINNEQDVAIVDISDSLKNYIIEDIYNTHFSKHSISVQTTEGTIEKYITNRDIFEILSVNSYIYTWIDSDGDRAEITVNYTIKNLPQEGWTDRAIKAENSPVLEIIENADVRVSGNAIFNIDSTSLTIGNNEKTVTFTFDQLEQLKQLLS